MNKIKLIQSALFEKQVKKLHKNQKKDLDKNIKCILKNPNIGQEKKGDLTGIFVYKFKLVKQLYLLAYRKNKNVIQLITLGSHENYYSSLKKYIGKVK